MISYISTKGRNSFKTCEDSLTSSVIDYLKYLPTSLFWRILRKSMYQNKLPKLSGELQSLQYWPKWNSTDTKNTNFVEPDVFLQFEDFDVLIEAKRYNSGGQSNSQLSKEVSAYSNEYTDNKKVLYFIKLGGLTINSNEEPQVQNLVICETDWDRLLKEVVELKEEFEKGNLYLSDNYIRLLTDCIKGFALHNFYYMEWLEDIINLKIKTLEIPLNL